MNYPKPLHDLVLIKRQKEMTVTKAGIVIPDSAQKTSMRAIVLAVGPGKIADNGVRVPMSVAEGDTVLITQWRGNEIAGEDREPMWFVKEDELLGVVEP